MWLLLLSPKIEPLAVVFATFNFKLTVVMTHMYVTLDESIY